MKHGKHSKGNKHVVEAPTYHSPSRQERMKMDSEHLARTLVETHPVVEKTRQQVAKRMMEVLNGMKISFSEKKGRK